MTDPSTGYNLLIKYFNEKSEDIQEDCLRNVSSEDIKHFMSYIGTFILTNLSNKSQLNIIKLITLVYKFHPDDVINNLKFALTQLAKFLMSTHNSINGNGGFGSSSYFGLKILTTIFSYSETKYKDTLKNLLQFFILLPAGCLLSEKRAIITSCKKLIKNFLNNSSLTEQIISIINNSEPKIPFLGFLSMICEMNFIKSKLNQEMLLSYAKLCFNDKYIIPSTLLINLKPLFEESINKSNFDETLLPIITRMTLRSPEKSLRIIKIVLNQLDYLDMSTESEEMSKVFCVQLQSKSDLLRNESKDCLLKLGSLSSESEAIKRIVLQIDKLLSQSGSEKISSAEIRQHIWVTLCELANHVTVGNTQSKDNLADSILSILIQQIQKESLEPVIISALESVASWSKLSTNHVSPMISTWFTDTICNPKLSSVLRSNYLLCLNNCYNTTEKLTGFKSILPKIQDLLERNSKSPATVAGVQELLPIVEPVLRYFVEMERTTDMELLKAHNLFNLAFGYLGFKQNVANVKLFSDQLVISTTKNGLKCLVGIIRFVVLHFYDIICRLPDHRAQILKCLLVCCIHNDYETVRKTALETLNHLSRSVHGEDIIGFVLDYLYNWNMCSEQSILSNWIWGFDNSSDSSVSVYDTESLRPFMQKLINIIDCVLKLENQKYLSLKNNIDNRFPEWCNNEVRVRIMSKALLAINQYMITSFEIDLWAKHAQNLIDSPDQVVAMSGSEIIYRLTNLIHLNKNDHQLIKCICRNFSDNFIDQVIEAVIEKLSDENLTKCTEDDVGIMNMPEGYLYNKALLDSLPKYNLTKANIKRENKMYSYKDQMAELEIRQEIENKKQKNQSDNMKENHLKNLSSQLTKNQMEQVNVELEKENKIRIRMKELENNVNLLCNILDNVSQWRKDRFVENFDKVVLILIKLIQGSPVARIKAALLYIKLRSKTVLGQKQSIWCLRIMLLDSVIFSDEFIESWKNNRDMVYLMELIQPWMTEKLSECSIDQIETIYKQILSKNMDFSSFIYVIPAFCQLCQSIVDMECNVIDGNSQWWFYLSWMDMEILKKILDSIYRQMLTGNVNKRQMFNTELLPVLVKVIQNSEIADTQSLVENIVLVMMKMFDESNRSTTESFSVQDTNVFDCTLKCFISDNVRARLLALKVMKTLIEQFSNDDYKDRLTIYLWIAKHDINDNVVEKADELWQHFNLSIDKHLVFKLLKFVTLPQDHVMIGSIAAIKSLIETYQDQLEPLVKSIFTWYDELAYLKPPVCDAFGRVLIPSPPDQWRSRYGMSRTLLALSEIINEKSLVENLFHFLIPSALSDRHEKVRASMLETGQKVIEAAGKTHINMLLLIMEDFLVNAENVAENDIIRQSVVILMGSLAKHLEATDERFTNIFRKLISALNFPSADVQRAVSDTFDPLMKAFSEEKQLEICNNLMQVLLNSNIEAERKGAAFGVAGMIKAIGITKLKSFKIYDLLIEAIQDKQNENHREIALFTFEQISAKMNKMFEAYVPGILKYLQETFADQSNLVRQTADRTAKMLMSNLSAPGVKLVLNPLLAGLDTNQWRTKAVSVELLGSMAHCAPKQLSNCLPTIVPKILSILSDSHPNVIKAGRQALREIGNVISNKEVQVIVPILIDALCEPNKKTNDGLNALIDTKFIHQVDAASLALIMSMVARSFKERRSETKRKAAQIIGNLHSLTDDKDLQPYCSSLFPGLKSCLVDPDPGVRTVASKALGTIAKVMKPEVYEELMCWLMETLKDETNGVNRSGAAQGLSEVLVHKGIAHLDKFMPDILENSRNQKLLAHVRDGYLMLYIYLPRLFQDQFAGYVELILPPILQALSDEVEFIRETALNAGQGIIDLYSHIAIDTMLPNLELGLFDYNWRIRYSSIRLLGELFFKLTGISGKGTTSGGGEDESFAQSSSQDILVHNLGQDTYMRVLAKIYICRMDVALSVKQASTHIWKLMVVNTARCLRWIMKDLMDIILDCLAETNVDSRIMCTKTLGDVVKKLGERILPDIFGHLEAGLEKCQSSGQNIGICTAISEILKASPRDQIVNYMDKILPTFKNCMINEDIQVREMAGEIFELLHSVVGVKIVEIVIPDLVDKLEDPVEADNALNGLCTLVSFKGRIVIPSLIPKLTHPTVNTKAFSKLAKVAGDILARHIVTVLPALLQAVTNVIDNQTAETEEVGNCCEVILAMDDPQVTQIILKDLTSAITNNKSTNEVIAALKIMTQYIKLTGSETLVNNKLMMNYIPLIIRSVVKLFLSDNKSILESSFDCLAEIMMSLGPNSVEFVRDVRDSIVMIIREKSRSVSSHSVLPLTNDGILIPAFCMVDKGINPFIELYREALVNGRPELKEVSASAMDDLISVTDTVVLGKAAVKITGSLIRTMTERHSAVTKAFIVSSLGKLIVKCPVQVKLFATQMQTIFVKCLSDPSQQLRYKTAIAQSKLAAIIAKPDQFFTEFVTREFNDENQYKSTGMEAVRFSLESAGCRLTTESLLSIIDIFKSKIGEKDDLSRIGAATCMGVALAHLNMDCMGKEIVSVFRKNTSVLNSHSLAVSLITLFKAGSSKIFSPDCHLEATNTVTKSLSEFCLSNKVFISSTGYRALGIALSYLIKVRNMERVAELLPLLQNGMKNTSMEINELVIDICGYLSWNDENGSNVDLYCKPVLAVLINGYRAKENQLRINSERRIIDLVQMSINLRKKMPQSTNGDLIDDSVYKTCCDSVEQSTRSALQEVVIRFKKSLLSGTKECPTMCPELDNTYNKIVNE